MLQGDATLLGHLSLCHDYTMACSLILVRGAYAVRGRVICSVLEILTLVGLVGVVSAMQIGEFFALMLCGVPVIVTVASPRLFSAESWSEFPFLLPWRSTRTYTLKVQCYITLL